LSTEALAKVDGRENNAKVKMQSAKLTAKTKPKNQCQKLLLLILLVFILTK
jgi:hypothetical protein